VRGGKWVIADQKKMERKEKSTSRKLPSPYGEGVTRFPDGRGMWRKKWMHQGGKKLRTSIYLPETKKKKEDFWNYADLNNKKWMARRG